MAKNKKAKIREHTGDGLHIEFPEWLEGDMYTMRSIILRPITSITVYGDNPNFEWEGSYKGESIRVVLPRQTNERAAVITGPFPNKVNHDRGTTYEQLYNELRRVLRPLD